MRVSKGKCFNRRLGASPSVFSNEMPGEAPSLQANHAFFLTSRSPVSGGANFQDTLRYVVALPTIPAAMCPEDRRG